MITYPNSQGASYNLKFCGYVPEEKWSYGTEL